MDSKEFICYFFCFLIFVCCFIPSSDAYDDGLFSDALIVINKNNDTFQGRQAFFGPRISEDGIHGKVIPMQYIENNGYGCKIIKEDVIKDYSEKKYNDNSLEEGFIALVARGGGCSFSEKVRNMQDSGASAVIVGNNVDDYYLIRMRADPYDDTSDIQIPSIFILQHDMYTIIKNYSNEDISIIEDDTEWPATDIFMVTTLLPILFIVGIFMLYKFRNDTFEDEFQRQESSASLGAATQEEVDALPIKIFDMKKKKENDPETCAVCIEDFKDGDKLRVLPCRHEYHVECIDLWLTTRKKFCPICKRNIDGEEDADENTPLLGRNNSNNNTYNSDASYISLETESQNSGEFHVIDVEDDNENEDHENIPNPQNDPLPSDDESDDPDENEPLINLVRRS